MINTEVYTKSMRMRALERFEQHLVAILPLYSVSSSDEKNQVISYAYNVLKAIGREPVIDKYWNLVAPATEESGDRRAIVAHTDTVGRIEHTCTRQSIRYNEDIDIFYNRSGRRAMGGDDKVGVAIALAVAEFLPFVHCWLVADEEIGCVGSGKLIVQPVDFALQFDRRGPSVELVNEIFGDLATAKTTKAALQLLPHRKAASGMITDVETLVSRELAGCAFNMSCGYYEPHSADEYIVLSEAMQSMLDAMTLMLGMDTQDFEKVSPRTRYGNFGRGYYGGEGWDEGVDWGSYQRDTDSIDVGKGLAPSGAATTELEELTDAQRTLKKALNWKLRSDNTTTEFGPFADENEAASAILTLDRLYGLPEDEEGEGCNSLLWDRDNDEPGEYILVSVDPSSECVVCGEACTSGKAAMVQRRPLCEDCLDTLGDKAEEFVLGVVDTVVAG